MSFQGEGSHFDLPEKKKDDICTIMYTSGTTGDPKGVLLSNRGIITLIAGVERFLDSVNEQVLCYNSGFFNMIPSNGTKERS